MIIGISGYMGSGKDTGGRIIQELTTFEIRKFATKLKVIAGLMLGVDPSKFESHEYKNSYLPEMWNVDDKEMTVREFLQRLGTDAVRNNVHVNSWVNALMCEYTEDSNWIITDVRFPNEAKAIKERGGIIIRLNRYVPGMSPAFMDLHESEKALDDWEFDEVIFNMGTIDDLRNQIREILIKLEKQNLITT